MNAAIQALEIATSKLEEIEQTKQQLIESQLTPEIKQAISDIELEYTPPIRAAQQEVYELTEIVKRETLEQRQTIKGDTLMAVYTPEGYSWDTRRLEGYAQANKDLWSFAKPKTPTVSIRKMK